MGLLCVCAFLGKSKDHEYEMWMVLLSCNSHLELSLCCEVYFQQRPKPIWSSFRTLHGKITHDTETLFLVVAGSISADIHSLVV